MDFTHAEADVGNVRLHYVSCGHGHPVVLLHGWPQTWYEWRHLLPLLADEFLLVAPDLRGLGDSTRPRTGYDTATVAADIRALMHDVLGYRRFAVVGHDWGGPVGYALAAGARAEVSHLAVIDVAIPGDGGANISQGGRRWHHAFHQTPDLPEALVAGREALYLGWFYDHYGATPQAVDALARQEYLRTYTQPDALRAGFEYYRNIPLDMAQNAVHLKAGKLDMPVLALGGTAGWGRGTEVIDSCRRMAHRVTGGVVERAGHWIPEEQPRALADALRTFLLSEPGSLAHRSA